MIRNSKFTKFSSIVIVLVILFSSCVSTTKIDTIPSGAKIYINDMYVGKTPYIYSDTKIIGSSTRLRFEKEGYHPFTSILTRNEDVEVGAVVAGIFTWIPLLWAMNYVPFHNFTLTPINEAEVPLIDSSSTTSSKTIDVKLLELKALYEKNLITLEEYESTRKKILEKEFINK